MPWFPVRIQLIIIIIIFICTLVLHRRSFGRSKDYFASRRKQVQFRMTMGNTPKHFRMRTARMKQDIDTEEEGKKSRVNMWKEVPRAEKKSSDGLTIARASVRRGHSVVSIG